jgi:hypothetical protein
VLLSARTVARIRFRKLLTALGDVPDTTVAPTSIHDGKQVSSSPPAAQSGHLDDNLAKPSHAAYLDSLPVHYRLCVQLFFKLLESLEESVLGKSPSGASNSPGKFVGILRLVHQLPPVLAQFPPLSMAMERRFQIPSIASGDGGGQPFAGVTGLLHNSLSRVYASMIEEDGDLASRITVLAALFGLAVRQGSLVNLLRIVEMLVSVSVGCTGGPGCACERAAGPAFGAMHPFLSELAHAAPVQRMVLKYACVNAPSACTKSGLGSFLIHGGFPTSAVAPSLVMLPRVSSKRWLCA